MIKKYRVIFHGLTVNKEAFKTLLVRMGAPPEIVDKMTAEAPVILKEGLSLELSRQYADAVQKAGGRVEIQEQLNFKDTIIPSSSIASFKDFTMCPECGLKQPKRERCVKCGFKLVKIEIGREPINATDN